ncbi:YggS family pyridoxal phosphate-dependent enzyme [Saccharibacillus sp. CPCC 101409]|uniref:YggS family pyridoxal phosphate-dependent enzyme n=1 Tax=Saccharibacillus sp. CPCC 101409 TaxID=3058041 RepID=UPI00267280E2|nr:YggS family pyridoxal phosphate-dependent enzyme [Saccharibacillus sp. CPCC 101409]MDO3409217.1 YggS family pyridoxal phosphate-dependent enzyme [Saccharibacillus sp. CPCC 101409]
MTLEQRIAQVNESIAEACKRAGRSPEEVNVVAVTKYVSAEMTGKVLDSGVEHIGENRWQTARPKWEALGDRGTWHFIGQLQSNKVKDIIGKFAYIHSLDRLSLARELERQAAAADIKIKAFVQVNISGEESKSGMLPEETFEFMRRMRDFPHIDAIGLMTMAPLDGEAEAARPVFRGLRELKDRLNASGEPAKPLEHLSMGMSGDFEVAIEEGATWVRLGSILVGKEED